MMSNTATRTRRSEPWHIEDIKAAVRKKTSFKELSQSLGLKDGACAQALRRQWPRCERAIADAIGVEPKELWPDRYNADGTPRGSLREQAAREEARRASESNRRAPRRGRRG